MQKRLKSSICITILSIAMLSGSLVFAEPDNIADLSSKNQIELQDDSIGMDEQVKVKDLDIDPIDTVSLRKSVVPDPKQEGKKVIGLFIKTMLGVAFCGALLYVVLYFVKKFWGDIFASKEYNKEVESLDLSTPETKEDAFKSFLNRTQN